ncbi:hypothetical protein VZ95_08780 [Elstera litoralis]|uniref:Endoribonuclease YbeY n=1 Tax=Elstera litoralis TaxID=552518 RepID=A0A0F3ITI7_9PROT|nr:hypothetical protein VZ95_08780 [Elstera litoralis]
MLGGVSEADIESLAEKTVRHALVTEAALTPFLAGSAPESRLTLALLFTDNAAVRKLNREWRDQDKPTNVLSFPGDWLELEEEDIAALAAGDDVPPAHIGDIALALETIRDEAAEQGKDPRAHLLHLIVHGTLHLLGYDHAVDAEAEAMEALETRLLADLGIADPYSYRPSGY